MVAAGGEVLEPALAGRASTVLEIICTGECHIEQHRHAALGEGEVVGAVEQAALGVVLGRDIAALRLGRAREIVFHLALPAPDQHDVAHGAGELQRVEGQVGDHLLHREERVLRIIFGAEKPALLARPGGEDEGPLRTRTGREKPRILQHRGKAERVIGRAWPYRLAVRVGRSDAVCVPMAAVTDRLVGIFRPGELAENVVAGDARHADGDVGGQRRLQVDRPEGRRPGLALHRVVIVAGALQQRGGGVALNPPLEQHRLRRVRGQLNVVALARGAFDDRPWIARRVRLMNDQRRDRAAPRRLFVLVRPAAVIGHGLAAELARDLLARRGLEVRVIDQHDGDLAFEVDALEIVPAALRRGHAITDEDHRRVGDADAIDRPHGAEIDIVGEAQRDRLAGLLHRDVHRRLQLGVDHRDGLGPAAILARRLEPGSLELRDEVRNCLVLAGGARRAALEFVRREDAGDFRHALGVHMRRRGGERAADESEQQQRRKQLGRLHRTLPTIRIA